MIFNLLKSKPTLKELIPEGFVDIHSHILPGIDDGAKNVEESLKMISEMEKIGVSKILATPHSNPGVYENNYDSIKKSYEKVIHGIGDKIQIDFSAEYMIDLSLIKKAENKSLLTFNDNYILIEMSYLSEHNDAFEIIFNLRLKGFNLILAHPERYFYLHNSFDKYKKLKDMGCQFQINLFSLVGSYGSKVTEVSKKLINKNFIDYAASDLHNEKQIANFSKRIKTNSIGKLEEILENTTKIFK